MTTNIAFYGSHNGGYAVERNGEILAVVEIERFLGSKNMGLAQYRTPQEDIIFFLSEHIPQYLMKYFDIDEFDTCYFQNTEIYTRGKSYNLAKFIPAKKYEHKLHHLSHAYGTFYQSPYKDALIFSFDGGGNDGMFNVYLGNREEGISLLERVLNPVMSYTHTNYNLGFPYMIFGHYLEDIKQESIDIGNLVYPGKLMGLSSYGNVMESWLPILKLFYKSNAEGHNYETFMKVVEAQVNTHLERTEDPLLTFDVNNRFSGQLAYDIAATSQRVFQDCFMEIAEPYLEKYKDLPVCITGGCGLNILLNTFLVEQHNREVFVGPNPNDCGLAAGMLLEQIKPKEPVDLTYSGLPLLDLDAFQYYLDPPSNKISVEKIDIEKLANDIYEGKIIGVARGRAEHGPRALGNRSILCNPSIPDMKDKLNAEVKKREWFRPFAPVVRLEDVNKYFHWDRESRWMSFCPRVREEWKEKLQAITHVDGTARVQTVTREQNEFLYDLITAFEKLNEVGVLLNTSFNVNGKPLVSTVSDAFDILYNTQLSGIVIEDNYVLKI